jgi:hypothetical protein
MATTPKEFVEALARVIDISLMDLRAAVFNNTAIKDPRVRENLVRQRADALATVERCLADLLPPPKDASKK